MAKKRVFDNFDPHNNVVENIDLTYPVQNFARNSKMVRIFLKKAFFMELLRHKSVIFCHFRNFSLKITRLTRINHSWLVKITSNLYEFQRGIQWSYFKNRKMTSF